MAPFKLNILQIIAVEFDSDPVVAGSTAQTAPFKRDLVERFINAVIQYQQLLLKIDRQDG